MPAPTLLPAATIGFAAGLRSATPWGALAARGRLGSGLGRTVGLLAAGGELVGDKLPAAPDRTEPPVLAGRVASGGLAGLMLGGLGGAAAGAAGGLAGSYLGLALRSALSARLPALPAAAVEDALAIGVAAWATRSAA